MFNIHTIRALKGAPMSIVVAMLLVKQPVGEGWLMSVTGYSQNTIRNGCKFLLECQMIRRNGRYDGYVLANGSMEIPMEIPQLGESQNMTLPSSTTTNTLNKKEHKISEEKEVEEDYRASKNDPRLVLLYSFGVMEPTASRLIEKSWVTMTYLEAHIDKANKEGTPVGLLIHRIREHDPMPKKKNEQDPELYRRSWIK
jgi:hypothetical protein